MQGNEGGERRRARGKSKTGLKEALDNAAEQLTPDAVGKTFKVVNIEVDIANPRVGEYRVEIEEQ